MRDFGEMRNLGMWAAFFILVSLPNVASAQGATAPAAGTLKAAGKTVTPLSGIQKIAVFPIYYAGERGARLDDATAQSLEETWWQVRDELAQTGRFMVATKAFLEKADAYQPRARLTPADAVILGRYVEADAVITMVLESRRLTISVWESNEGAMAWHSTVELHPSIQVREQMPKLARQLAREFIAAIPYHGITIQDDLARSAIFDEGGKKLARVRIGTRSAFKPGDEVQWLTLERANLDPLFLGGAKTVVRAEGTVVEVNDQTATVELRRIENMGAIRAGALVFAPAERARLETFTKQSKDITGSQAVLSLLATGDSAGTAIEPEGKRKERERDETGALATTLSILGSLAVVLLLAF